MISGDYRVYRQFTSRAVMQEFTVNARGYRKLKSLPVMEEFTVDITVDTRGYRQYKT